MKYIHIPGDDAIEWDRYYAYIEPLKDSFPAHFRDLATNSVYYDLSSAESLHDAKLADLRITELPPDEIAEIPSILHIHIELRGARRRTNLLYKDVRRYGLTGENDFGYFDSFHSDLYTHEFRIETDGYFTHEMEFVTASRFLIEFKDLEVTQQEYE